MESSSQVKEIIQEYGARSVSLKTNIPVDALERIQRDDYNSFTKMQLLGFAKIFEREYEIDLIEYKNDIREYFVKNGEVENSILVNQVAPSSESFFLKFLSYLFMLGVLYGAWYIYQNFYKKSMETNVVKVENGYFDIEKNKSTLDTKKESIYSIQALEKSHIEKIEKDKKKTILELNTTTSIATSNHSISFETNHSFDIANSETMIKEELNTTEPSTINLTEDNIVEENLSVAETNTTVIDPIIRTSIDIVPSQKSWFRMSNMKTHRYRTYRTQTNPHRVELSQSSWLMVSKKGVFTFIDNNVSKEYNSNQKILYFKLDKESGVTQLDQQEYKKLGGHGVR